MSSVMPRPQQRSGWKQIVVVRFMMATADEPRLREPTHILNKTNADSAS